LEELNQDFSWLMGDLLADHQEPTVLSLQKLDEVLDALRAHQSDTRLLATGVFHDAPGAADAVERFESALRVAVLDWHSQVRRLHQEYQELVPIVSTREIEQKK